MADLSHRWSGDLALGPTGDLALAAGPALGTQRVLRRLLTNPGDYIWHLDYGAGLARFVGQPASTASVQATVRAQIFREAAVARTPEPSIDAASDQAGAFYVNIRYADAETAQTQTLGIPLLQQSA